MSEMGGVIEKRDALIAELLNEIESLRDQVNAPIPMVLCCPQCGEQHIDRVKPDQDWDNPPHKTHQCDFCDHHWRPADVYTEGVACTKTFGKTADRGGAVSTPVKNHVSTISRLGDQVNALTAELDISKGFGSLAEQALDLEIVKVDRLEAQAKALTWTFPEDRLPEDEDVVLWLTDSITCPVICRAINQLCARENFLKLCPDLKSWMPIPPVKGEQG